jgi:hypothetical protein
MVGAQKRFAVYAVVVAAFAYVSLCFLLTAEGSGSVMVEVTVVTILASLAQCRNHRRWATWAVYAVLAICVLCTHLR